MLGKFVRLVGLVSIPWLAGCPEPAPIPAPPGGGAAALAPLSCDDPIVPSPTGPVFDACDGVGSSTVVAGPVTVERTTGSPGPTAIPFALSDGGQVCVQVLNHENAASTVDLDDETVIRQSQLNPHVTEVRAARMRLAGAHEVVVEMAGQPGTSLDVTVWFAEGVSGAAHDPVVGTGGLTARNLNDDPDPFSPNADGFLDATAFTVNLDIAGPLPGQPSGQFTYELRGAFEVAGGAFCADTATLPFAFDVVGTATFLALEEWDGTLDGGGAATSGEYRYRAVAELVRTRIATGDEEVIGSVATHVQSVLVDVDPPLILTRTPYAGSNRAAETRAEGEVTSAVPLAEATLPRIHRDSIQPSEVDVGGRILDPLAGVVSSTFTVNGAVASLPLDPDGGFLAAATLITDPRSGLRGNAIEVGAEDAVGNSTVLRIPIWYRAAMRDERLAVRFNADAGRADIERILDELGPGVGIESVRIDQRFYLLDLPSSLSASVEAARLLVDEADLVAFAAADAIPIVDVYPDDASYDLEYQSVQSSYTVDEERTWQLKNDGYDGFSRYAIEWGADCLADVECSDFQFGATCNLVSSRCECASDSDCLSDHQCILDATPTCGIEGVVGADIGWDDVAPTGSGPHPIEDLDAGPITLRLAVIDPSGVPPFDFGELKEVARTNSLECCGSTTSCPDVDANGLPDCTRGEAGAVPCSLDIDCGGGGNCVRPPAMSRCVVSDGMGFLMLAVGDACTADLECVADPDGGECATLSEVGTCTDGCAGACGVDDDGDGFADGADYEVAALSTELLFNGIDDDNDASVDEADEAELVAWDDDEDGLIDDIRGYDFGADDAGLLFGHSHEAETAMPGDHAMQVALFVAAAIHNADRGTGVLPNVEVLGYGIRGTNDTWLAMSQAATDGADLVVMSYGATCTPAAACESTYQPQFDAYVDPNTLYVLSAGNSRNDIDTQPAVLDQWRVPTMVDSLFAINVVATNARDEFADYWTRCGLDATSTAQCVTGDLIEGGSSFGSAGATSDADVGAPGDSLVYMYRDAAGGSFAGFTNGTSFSAPITAGVAGLGILAFPGHFRHQPLLLRQRVFDTVDVLPDLAGRCATEGRVDVANMLDDGAFPLVGLSFVDDTASLNDTLWLNTHDVDFIDADQDGTIDMMFEIMGGPFIDQAAPRMFEFDYGTQQWTDVSAVVLDPALVGNFNKADAGDVNGDGCTDLVLGGFVQEDPSPPVPATPLMGLPNRLFLQDSSGAVCLKTWLTEGVIPQQDDITRDADLVDFDLDGDLDIFFTNATLLSLNGGDFADQLLVNDGTGSFTDESFRVPANADTNDDDHKTASSCDIDADGFEDLLFAINEVGTGGGNRVLLNVDDGAGGREFVDITATAGLGTGTDFSHDIECHDFTGDGFQDLVIARRDGLKNLFYVNDGDNTFTDSSTSLPEVLDTTQEVEVCDLNADGVAELLFGNGDILTLTGFENRVVTYDPTTGVFVDDTSYGFNFTAYFDVSEDIECADMDGDGTVDFVFIGNTGERNILYKNTRGSL